jgi:hypothetical protein
VFSFEPRCRVSTIRRSRSEGPIRLRLGVSRRPADTVVDAFLTGSGAGALRAIAELVGNALDLPMRGAQFIVKGSHELEHPDPLFRGTAPTLRQRSLFSVCLGSNSVSKVRSYQPSRCDSPAPRQHLSADSPNLKTARISEDPPIGLAGIDLPNEPLQVLTMDHRGRPTYACSKRRGE